MSDTWPVSVSNKIASHVIGGKVSGQSTELSIHPGETKSFDLNAKTTLILKSYSEGLPSKPGNCPVYIRFSYNDGVDVSMVWNEKKEEWLLKLKKMRDTGLNEPKEVNVTIGEPEL